MLDELIRLGYRAYVCGDPGYGVVIAWARSDYMLVDLLGEPGFKREVWAGESIPTTGLVPDLLATVTKVSEAIGCDNVRRAKLEPSLEHLISSSVRVVVDDLGRVRLRNFNDLTN